ncbi:hypothetical protein N333_08345, partial [Nestor notabilis]
AINQSPARNQHTCTAESPTSLSQPQPCTLQEDERSFAESPLVTDTRSWVHSQSSIAWLSQVWLSEMFKYGKK